MKTRRMDSEAGRVGLRLTGLRGALCGTGFRWRNALVVWGLAVWLGCWMAAAGAAEGGSAKPSGSAGSSSSRAATASESRPRPLSGRIAEVDHIHKTIKVGKSVVYITSETRIFKDGKPAILEDAKVGDEVGISYVRAEDGRMLARSVRIGPKPAEPPRSGGAARPDGPSPAPPSSSAGGR